MSFSQSVKEEILKNIQKIKGCCAASFLTAVLKSTGCLCLENGEYCFTVETDNLPLLEMCNQIAQKFDAETIIYQVSGDNDGKNKYTAKLDISLGDKLNLVHFDSDGSVHINDNPLAFVKKDCCRRTFMQTLFLCCGSVTVPVVDENFATKHANYHLELRFSNEQFAECVKNQFAEIDFKQTQRKSNTLLYIKDSEKIADFFSFVDAVNSRFAVENVIIGRSLRNNVNRQSNCIGSNLDKTALACAKQLAAIKKLRASGRLQTLPEQLMEVVAAREENPSASLTELSAIMKISKSGVNHRMAKLMEIAEETP